MGGFARTWLGRALCVAALVQPGCGERVNLGGAEGVASGGSSGADSGSAATDGGQGDAAGSSGAAGSNGAAGADAGPAPDVGADVSVAVPRPLAYYSFDASTVAGGTLADLEGSHPGALMGMSAPTLMVGVVDGALAFDGVDDFVELDSFPQIVGEHSIAVWVNFRSPPDFFGDPAFFDKWDWVGDQRSFGVGVSRGRLNAAISLNGTHSFSPHATDVLDVDSELLDVWIHVAVTYDGDEVLLFRDGQPITRSLVKFDGPLFVPSPDIPVWIGRSRGTDGVFLDALLDDLVIWNLPLVPEQVRALFERGRRGEPAWDGT